jgi:hypothetical protein
MQPDLSQIPTAELSPRVLSSKRAYLGWAFLYSAIHLSLCGYLLLIRPPTFSPEYNWAVAALIAGPFFYLPDLYLRQIWWPYRQEMKRRGGVPPRDQRKHPYDLEVKLLGLVLFFAAIAGLVASIRFIWFASLMHYRWATSLVLTLFTVPWCLIGFYHTYFIWKGRTDGRY